MAPPSTVANVLPSGAETTADCASVARTSDRSVASGNGTREKLRPSVDRRITPPRPTTQQTNADGAATAVSVASALNAAVQEAPPSVEVSTRGEYTYQRQDALRDDSRTNLPIVIRDPATGLFRPSKGFERRRLSVDALFSYQPTPGTVFFAGYSSLLAAPQPSGSVELRRSSDGFYVKASYLFRL